MYKIGDSNISFLCLDLMELFEDGEIERKENGNKGKPPVLTVQVVWNPERRANWKS